LLTIVGRSDRGFGMGLGGVLVDCGCGLGAEIADLRIEIERTHAVGAVRARELHSVLDALDPVGFHCFDCSPLRAALGRDLGNEGNARFSRPNRRPNTSVRA
jgi:hypothetical protein